MALVLDDRVRETSTTTGTGTLNLDGAVSGFQTFVAGVGNSNTTYYAIIHRTEAEWELGVGTVTDASTDTLARTTVLSSSNSDSAVSFSAGTKDVFVTQPASKALYSDASGHLTVGAGADGTDYKITFDGHAADGVLTWMEDEDYFKFSDDVLMNSTEKLMFQDTGTYIYSNADGDLDVVSDGTAVDSINLESAGGITLDAGTAGSGIIYEDDGTEMARIYNSSSDVILETKVSDKDFSIKGNDGGSAITALSFDMSAAGAATFNDKVIATELDISGNMDIDGTSNLDAVDIDGAVQLDATLTVGADDQGYDIKFFGDTASAYMLWDTSADDLVFAGDAGIDLAGDIDVDGTANLDNTDIDGTLAVDGTTISLDATTSLNIDNSNTSNGITIGTATSGVPISIGHGTSEVTVNDNLTVTGTLTLGSGAELSEAELEMLDGITAGTVAASKAVVVDSNKDIASFRNVTLTGELDAATLDISGNADIDGTTNLDAVDIDGAVQLDATLTVGADDQGYDIKFFGDTASAYMLWDTSADDLVLAGAAGIDLAGDIDVDGTANLDVVDIDGAVDMATTLTLGGNADFNGDLDVDGTTNLDAVDIDGNVQIDGTVTVGVDDTGKDVKFFGATSGSYALWDESADSLLLTDSTPIKVGDAQDMTLYHDGTNSFITNATGALKLATETSGIAVTIGHSTSEVTVADNLTVTGDLTVSGTTTTVNSTTVNLNDHNIVLDSGNSTSAVVNGGGITLEGGSGDDATFTYNTTGPKFELKLGSSYEDLKVAQLIASSLDIDGTITVGVDDTGYDVKFFGATSGKYMEWDESADQLDVAGSLDVTGNTGMVGTLTVGVDNTGHDVKFFGATSGKYMEWDESADQLDVTGSLDVTGNTGMVGTLTVGVDDTGHDVKFFGATSGAYMLWDESTDDLVLAGAAKLYLYDAGGGENISSDGTDLTIASGAKINLTATSDVVVPANVGITFGTGEKIEGDNTDLTITSGAKINLTATSDVVIPANVGITFGTGEKIEGDSTDLTITSGAKINLTATSDVVIPANVGITFGTGEKIEGDNTDLTITSGADIALTATADVNVPPDVGMTFGDDGEKIEGDGTDLTIASSGVINLAAGGSTNQIKVTDGAILPITDDDVDLGSASYQFKNGYFDGTLEADAITIGGSAVTAGGASTADATALAIALG